MTLATKFTAPCPATESHIVLFDICLTYVPRWASQVAIVVKNLPPNARDAGAQVSIPGSGRFPGGGNPLQYSCLENPWTEESGWLQSIGSQRIRHDWASKHMFLDMRILSLSFCEFMYLCISNCLKKGGKEIYTCTNIFLHLCVCVWVGGCSVMSDSLRPPVLYLFMEFSRQEYWTGLPFPPPMDLLNPQEWACVSCISYFGRPVLYHWATREAHRCQWK